MKTDRDLMLVSLLTFVTVFLWIAFELTKTTKTSTVTNRTQQLIQPFTPTLDSATLDSLEAKQTY
jgi:hypothetical protein